MILKVRYNGDIQKGQANIATIKSDQSCLISGGPALIKIEENNLCYIEVENCSKLTTLSTKSEKLRQKFRNQFI